MKHVVITGSSSGIGFEITRQLLQAGFLVSGICRRAEYVFTDSDNYKGINFDLSEPASISDNGQIKELAVNTDVLILNAGFAKFEPHEEQKEQDIISMINVNLTAPLLLMRVFLRGLKKRQGHSVFIGSHAGLEGGPWSGVYGATKAGLIHFARQIFTEVRKSGVSIILINPDITNTPFYEDLKFEPQENEKTANDPSEIARLVAERVIKAESGFAEISLRPQIFRISRK